jgi:hypothetical protein
LEPAEDQITLDRLPVGSRLLVRSRTDWRYASVARVSEDRIVLTICSPSGRTYRLRRGLDAELVFEGIIPILKQELEENWRDNFSRYDRRW